MTYARMKVVCKDELICDFAQYYHIYDVSEMRLTYQATLACGLPSSSRTLMKMAGLDYTAEQAIQMGILDTLRSIEHAYISVHSKTKPQKLKSIFELLKHKKDDTKSQS